MNPTIRKSGAKNLLMWSDLTFGASFKVKRRESNLKVLMTHLLFLLEIWDVKPTYTFPNFAAILNFGRNEKCYLVRDRAILIKFWTPWVL